MRKEVDFNTECRVHILCKDENGQTVQLTYERSQLVDDDAITEEALYIYEDSKRGGIGNVSELAAIFIARNEDQESQMEAETITIQ